MVKREVLKKIGERCLVDLATVASLTLRYGESAGGKTRFIFIDFILFRYWTFTYEPFYDAIYIRE